MNSEDYRRRIFLERLARLDEAVISASTRPDRLTQGASELARALRELLQVVRHDFEERWTALDSLPPDERTLFRSELLEDVQDAIVETTNWYLPILLGARTGDVPVEYELVVAALLERFCPGTRLTPVLWASTEYSYAQNMLDHPVEWYEPSPVGEMPRPAFVDFQLPSIERDSALLHGVLVGHELGHALDRCHQVSESLVVPDAPNLKALTPNQTDDLPLSHASYIFSKAALSWAREFAADILSALMFGPVALFSFTEFSETTGSAQLDSVSHPASDRRFEVICRVLEASGLDAVGAISDWITTFRSAYPDAGTRPVSVNNAADEAGCQHAWDWIATEIDALIEGCKAALGGESFNAESWQESEEAANRLLGGHVVGELIENDEVRSVPVAVILNAGWLVKVNHLDEFGTLLGLDAEAADGVGHIAETLDGMIAKSIEVSFHRDGHPWE